MCARSAVGSRMMRTRRCSAAFACTYIQNTHTHSLTHTHTHTHTHSHMHTHKHTHTHIRTHTRTHTLTHTHAQVSDDSLSYIFQAILDWHLMTKGYPHYIRKMSPKVIAATLQLYSNVSMCMCVLLQPYPELQGLRGWSYTHTAQVNSMLLPMSTKR